MSEKKKEWIIGKNVSDSFKQGECGDVLFQASLPNGHPLIVGLGVHSGK